MHPVFTSTRSSMTSGPATQKSVRSIHSGFTLIELLVVLALMVLVMSFVAPAVNSMLDGNNLTTAGQMISDEIKLARQIASSGNRTVRVCLITVPPLAGTNPGYNAIQLWTAVPAALTGTTSAAVSTNVNYIPASKLVILPTGVAISQNKTPPTVTAPNAPGLSALIYYCAVLNMPAGYPNAGAPYVAFDVKPTGVVVPYNTITRALPGMSGLYLTVVPTRLAGVGGAATTPPPNYATIEVDPITGTTIIYRP